MALTPEEQLAQTWEDRLEAYGPAAADLAYHYLDGEAEKPAPVDYLPVIAAALLATLDRLDAFAAGLAGMTDELKAATSGGLLGLLTGGRK